MDAACLRIPFVLLGVASLHHWHQVVDSLKDTDHCLKEEDHGLERIYDRAAELEARPLVHTAISAVYLVHNS